MEEVLPCPRPKLRDHFEAFLYGQKIDSGEIRSSKSFASHAEFEGSLSGTEVRIKTESFDCEPPSQFDFLRVPIKTEKLDEGTRSGSGQDVGEIDPCDTARKPLGIKTEKLDLDDVGVPCHPTTSSSFISHGIKVKKEKEDSIGIKTETEENDRCALVKRENHFHGDETSQQIPTDCLVKDEADSSHRYHNTDGESINNLGSTPDGSMDHGGSAVKANDPEHSHYRSRDRKAKNIANIMLKNLEENVELVDLNDGKQVGMVQTAQCFFSNRKQSSLPWKPQNMNNEFNKYKGTFSLQECSVKVRRLSEEVLFRYGITLDVSDKKVDVHTLKKGLFSCSECSFRSHHVKELREHQWKHRTDTAYHKCMECNYRTKWVHGIASHVRRVHRKLKPYQCPHCDYRTATSTALKMHINVHTSHKPYKCPYCNYRSVAQASLRSHVYTHTGEKPYACPHCSYRSTQYAHLKSHLYVHTKEKPYACELCEYKTTQSTHLRSHMQVVHTDVKPFKCEHCSYASKSLAGLKIHVRKHTGERPYVCMICSYKTTQSTSLRVHMRGHLETRRCQCSVCGYSTHTAFSLKNHIAACHETN